MKLFAVFAISILTVSAAHAASLQDCLSGNMDACNGVAADASLKPNIRANAYARIAEDADNQNDRVGALDAIDRAIKLTPKDGKLYVTRAMYALKDADFDYAERSATEAIRQGDLKDGYMMRGIIRTYAARSKDAIADFQAFLAQAKKTSKSDPVNDMVAAGFTGMDWINEKKYDRAIAALSAPIVRGYDHPTLYMMRAQALMAEKKYGLAIADLTAAIKSRKKDALLYYMRAEAYAAVGLEKKAAMDRTSAAAIDSGIFPEPRAER